MIAHMLTVHRPANPVRTISAVVPTLNEERGVADTLETLRGAGVDEIVVVDGGSVDDTVAKAQHTADVVARATGGLFRQLNAGAEHATGRVLLFHYADVLFPADGVEQIHRTLDDPAVAGGAFRLSFASEAGRYRFIAGGTQVRNRLGMGPFGDQSIFVRREVFEALAGYRADDFLSDHQLVRRVKRAGTFVLLDSPVRASTRRWERQGVIRTLARHWFLTGLYLAGKRRQRGRPAEQVEQLRTVR